MASKSKTKHTIEKSMQNRVERSSFLLHKINDVIMSDADIIKSNDDVRPKALSI